MNKHQMKAMKTEVFAKCMKVFTTLMLTALLTGCSGDQYAVQKQQTETVQHVEQELPNFIAEGIRKLSIVENQAEVLNIVYEPKEYESTYEYWKISIPYGEEAVVDTEALLALFYKIERLELEAVSEYPEDIIDELKAGKLKITWEYCSGGRDDENAYMANADSTATLLLYEAEDDYYAAYQDVPQIIYKVSRKEIDEIIGADTFGLILKISAVANIDTVETVIINMDGEEYRWNPKEETYRSLYTELLSILLKAEIEGGERNKVDQEKDALLSLQFVRNIADMPDLVVKYREYDSKYAVLSVNGVENFLVNRADIEALKEKIRSAS